jgi:hypothetical protein
MNAKNMRALHILSLIYVFFSVLDYNNKLNESFNFFHKLYKLFIFEILYMRIHINSIIFNF